MTITQPRRKFRESFNKGWNGHAADASVTHMDDPSHHINMEDSKVIGDDFKP